MWNANIWPGQASGSTAACAESGVISSLTLDSDGLKGSEADSSKPQKVLEIKGKAFVIMQGIFPLIIRTTMKLSSHPSYLQSLRKGAADKGCGKVCGLCGTCAQPIISMKHVACRPVHLQQVTEPRGLHQALGKTGIACINRLNYQFFCRSNILLSFRENGKIEPALKCPAH